MSVPAKQVMSRSSTLTVDAVKAVMPKRQKHNITQSLVDELNQLVTEPEAREVFRENLLGYSSVLQDPNVRLPTYVDAVRYVSFQLMGDSNQTAWIKTFPDRYQRLRDMGKDDGFIRATVACYNRNKVVNKIREQSLIPAYIANYDMYQEALNEQRKLMLNAKSEKVRSDAAKCILEQLKLPETTKVSLDVNVKEDDSIRELRETTLELVKAQKLAIESGTMDAKRIAEAKIINGEFSKVD